MADTSDDSRSRPEDSLSAEILTFLIADIRGYTLFTQQRGDEAAAALASRFASLVREEIEGHGGRLIELRGDETLAVFGSARQAIRTAVGLQQRLVRETTENPSLPLPVGIGIDAGEAVRVEGGYRGGALNLAARLCARAGAGEILASREAVHLARKIDGVRYLDGGALSLKGMPDPVPVTRVLPEGDDPALLLGPYRLGDARSRPRPRLAPLRWALRSRRRLAITGLALVALGVGVPLALTRQAPPAPEETDPPTLTRYLVRVNPSTRQVLARIPIGRDPVDVAVGEGSVWVLDGDGSVRRIDPVTNTATVIEGVVEDPSRSGREARAIAAGEGWVWVTDGLERIIHRIDPASNRVAGSVVAGGIVTGVATGRGAVWAVRGDDGQILRIDPTSGRSSRIGELPLPRGAPVPFVKSFVAVTEREVWTAAHGAPLLRIGLDGGPPLAVRLGLIARDLVAHRGAAWVATCGTPGTVLRVDERGEVTRIAAGGTRCDMVPQNRLSIAAGSEGIWVSDEVNGTVSRIRELTNQVDAPIEVGGGPIVVAVGLGSVWVAVNQPPAQSPP